MNLDKMKTKEQKSISESQQEAEEAYVMGQMYYEGNRVQKDYEEAVRWFKKAASLSHKRAQFRLCEMYYYGFGVEKNEEEAFYWRRESRRKKTPRFSFVRSSDPL